MSGGYYPYPKHVWSPSGGWWYTPKNYKRNTVFIGIGIAICMGTLFTVSRKLEFDPSKVHDQSTIKRWNDAVLASNEDKKKN